MPAKTKPTRGKVETKKTSASNDRLALYRAKRHFGVTPEPGPDGAPPRKSARQSSQKVAERGKKTPADVSAAASPGVAFVVQKHDARRLHYDVRLEIDGAMASWAVPKGPSYDPAVRRLAVQTEDHPMAYNAFEGRIPDGEYGAGDVLIWDRGTYETVPPGQWRAMMTKGHLHIRLFGEKLKGDWHLIRTGGRGGDDGTGESGKAQWLMFKAKDVLADPGFDVVAERPESVVSGRVATRGPRRVGASEKGASAHKLFDAVGQPLLAKLVEHVADEDEWLFEVKYDGYRIVASKAGPDVRLYTRSGLDWTDRFRPIADGVGRLKARECVIDGEACVVDEKGRPSFAALQQWLSKVLAFSRDKSPPPKGPIALGYVAFDLLWLDGRDLRTEPIEARRELLERLLDGQGAPLSFSRTVNGSVDELLKAAKASGLEGLVGKRKGSIYSPGRTGVWIKLRFDRTQDCVIAGWAPLANTADQVGALLLAVAEQGKLVYAGRVGTGFDTQSRRELRAKLARLKRSDPGVESAPRDQGVHWVEPTLVCECEFKEWTSDGSMRHPRYVRLREDKAPLECVRDVEAAVAEPRDRSPAIHRETPKLANPDKVLFPRDGITKKDVWDYYSAVAPVMLPHLAGRPLTLQRYPNGIDGEEWYQQNAPDKTPPFVRLLEVGPRHGAKKRIVCDTVETLQWLANLAALTLHQWTSHVPASTTSQAAIDQALSSPDYVVLDLDPGEGPWTHLVEVARAVKTLLDALGMDSLVKTSGKRGVHVVVPIAPGATHVQATSFAEHVARAVAKVLPKIATVERMKDKRSGKLYVDYGQNGEGKTIVAPYTIRARDGAVVSMPVTWDELGDALDPTKFTLRSALHRIEKKGDLFAGAIRGTRPLPNVG
jgi:bifunctional non-homologous end joining protein LigD